MNKSLQRKLTVCSLASWEMWTKPRYLDALGSRLPTVIFGRHVTTSILAIYNLSRGTELKEEMETCPGLDDLVHRLPQRRLVGGIGQRKERLLEGQSSGAGSSATCSHHTAKLVETPGNHTPQLPSSV